MIICRVKYKKIRYGIHETRNSGDPERLRCGIDKTYGTNETCRTDETYGTNETYETD